MTKVKYNRVKSSKNNSLAGTPARPDAPASEAINPKIVKKLDMSGRDTKD